MFTESTDKSQAKGQLKQAIEGILRDRPVGYHPLVARAVGSVTAGIFLSQLLYWTPRSQDPDGWLWKTREQIFTETALTRYEQETARRILRQSGILQEKLTGVPCRMHYRVNLDRLTELLATTQMSNPPPTSWGKSHQLDGYNSTNKPAAKPPTTTEITSRDSSLSNSSRETLKKQRGEIGESYAPAPDLQPGSAGFSTATETLVRKYQPRKSLDYSQEREAIAACVRDIGSHLGDRASNRSSTTRAVNLFAQSGFALNRFIAAMYEAQSITKNPFDQPPKNKMAYWFSVLGDLTGAKAPSDSLAKSSHDESSESSQVNPSRLPPFPLPSDSHTSDENASFGPPEAQEWARDG